jgi:hypothetical protein
MRLRLALAALSAFPVALASYLVGCSSELPLENLCGWIGDQNNCYRDFARQVGPACGNAGEGSAPLGFFLARDKLDICVLGQGGQIVFDPPLDLAQFPLTTASFKLMDEQGNVCGAASFARDGAMSITVESVPPVKEGGRCETDGGTSDAGPAPGSQLCGGTFSVKPVTERELVDTSCPGGETHHFNRLQLSKCSEYDQLFPKAEVESNPGGVGVDGFVKFRIFYPPTTGALENAPAKVIEYFECVIPGGEATCANNEQDPNEPDVDCGAVCPNRCAVGQKCQIAIDCMSQTCQLSPLGMRVCQPNPNCGNMMKDPAEGDVDCGMVCNNPCSLGDRCNVTGDCLTDAICTPDASGVRVCTAP